jgi:hypothetical protein
MLPRLLRDGSILRAAAGGLHDFAEDNVVHDHQALSGCTSAFPIAFGKHRMRSHLTSIQAERKDINS